MKEAGAGNRQNAGRSGGPEAIVGDGKGGDHLPARSTAPALDPTRMKIHLIYNRIPHHAPHSGYDQIARYLVDLVSLESVEGAEVPRMIPWRAWKWLIDSSSEWLAHRSGMSWYGPYALALEARTALRFFWGNGNIYHILFGEDTYRYLGSLSHIARWKGSRIVCTYHQPPQIFDQVVTCKSMLKKLDAVIVVASNQATYFASLVGEKRVFVIPHGIDTDFYRPMGDKPSDGKVCLFVGHWLRDFNMLRAVIKRVAASGSSVKFKIITREENAASLTGLDNVVALGRLSDTDLLQAYQSADLLVLPLIDCTANNALLEGLACGLPIVTTDVGGVRDYVDSDCARIVRSGDVEGMCEAILSLTANERLRTELSRQSRLRALAYDWRRITDRLIYVYQTLLG